MKLFAVQPAAVARGCEVGADRGVDEIESAVDAAAVDRDRRSAAAVAAGGGRGALLVADGLLKEIDHHLRHERVAPRARVVAVVVDAFDREGGAVAL